MIAIIEAGGKQFIVTTQQKIQIEKSAGEAGEAITFDKVLLVANEDGTGLEVGAPLVATTVAGIVTKQYRTRKIIVRKFKNKVRYHRTAGHRQHQTEVEIGSLGK